MSAGVRRARPDRGGGSAPGVPAPHRRAGQSRRWAGIEDVSLTVLERGRPRSVVFTGPLAVDLDERQYELGFGPCLDAAKTGQTIVVDSRQDDAPYREFARAAGLRRCPAHRLGGNAPRPAQHRANEHLPHGGHPVRPQLPGTHPTVRRVRRRRGRQHPSAMPETANEVTHLRIAMESRAVIEQAKGIIMVRDHCTADKAYQPADPYLPATERQAPRCSLRASSTPPTSSRRRRPPSCSTGRSGSSRCMAGGRAVGGGVPWSGSLWPRKRHVGARTVVFEVHALSHGEGP